MWALHVPRSQCAERDPLDLRLLHHEWIYNPVRGERSNEVRRVSDIEIQYRDIECFFLITFLLALFDWFFSSCLRYNELSKFLGSSQHLSAHKIFLAWLKLLLRSMAEQRIFSLIVIGNWLQKYQLQLPTTLCFDCTITVARRVKRTENVTRCRDCKNSKN